MSGTKDAEVEEPMTEVGVEANHNNNSKNDRTIVTEQGGGENGKDDCSDLTDNNVETEESAAKSFPQKLLDILSNDEHSDVISWLPHGNGFLIHKKKAFANDILPIHFKASKFTSFTRKLNRWGFSRAPRGPETGAYFHKLFCRDKPELSLQMTSNSGNKYQSAPQGQQLLPAVPMMMGQPGQMPFYMPSPQMAMLTPQQQQALWQQQMQLYQFQQMQMMHYQQAGGGGGAVGGGGGVGRGGPPPMMMMGMQHPLASAANAHTTTTTTNAATTTTAADPAATAAADGGTMLDNDDDLAPHDVVVDDEEEDPPVADDHSVTAGPLNEAFV